MKRFMLFVVTILISTTLLCCTRGDEGSLNDMQVDNERILASTTNTLNEYDNDALIYKEAVLDVSTEDNTYVAIEVDNYVYGDIYVIINKERKELGLNVLEFDDSLAEVGHTRCVEIFDNDCFSHERPDGSMWWTVIDECGIYVDTAGENLAQVSYNYGEYSGVGAYYWVDLWTNSPSHYEIMMKADFTHVGISTYRGIRDGTVVEVAVAIFASY